LIGNRMYFCEGLTELFAAAGGEDGENPGCS
jgi:hypothetical protein